MTITEERPSAPAPAATERIPHIRALDGLRGFAVLIVVLSHFTPNQTPGGFLGVDLFFLLSGFLITSLLVSEFETNGAISLGMFWIRRARRLLPALLVVLVVVGAYTALFKSRFEAHQLGLDGLSSLFYVANWRFIVSGQSYVLNFVRGAPSPLRHMWSLAIEEQFYLVWPLVVGALIATLRRVKRTRDVRLRRPLATVCLVLGVASAAWMVHLAAQHTNLDRIYYGTDSRVFMILVGAFIGALTVGRPILHGRPRTIAIGVGAIAFLALLALTITVETHDRWLYLFGYVLIAFGMGALLIAAAQPGPNPIARIFHLRPLVGLGLISYGVYLWHWPIATWLTAKSTGWPDWLVLVARIALTMGAALLSYWLVEQPIRRRGLSWAGAYRWFVAPLAVFALAVTMAIPVLAFPEFAPSPYGSPPDARSAVQTAAYAEAPHCDTRSVVDRPYDSNAPVVAVYGNSLAGEITPCVESIMAGAGYRSVNIPMPDGFHVCRDHKKIIEQANDPASRPDVAIYFALAAFGEQCPGRQWNEMVDDMVDTWLANGTQVYLVSTIPSPIGGFEEFTPGADAERAHYQELAAKYPGRVHWVDAGRFIRNTEGEYLWRMQCLPGGEIGCAEDGTIGVRFIDGIHFCTDPQFGVHSCPNAEDAGGERRVGSAIAQTVLATVDPARFPVRRR